MFLDCFNFMSEEKTITTPTGSVTYTEESNKEITIVYATSEETKEEVTETMTSLNIKVNDKTS